MPLMKIHVHKGRTPEETGELLDAIHDTMVSAFKVPPRDRYQILNEHEAMHFKALDTGLDIQRTKNFVLVEVVTRPRSREEKLNFYDLLAGALSSRCAIESSDIMVSITQNTDDDWSFGLGEAQFITGAL